MIEILTSDTYKIAIAHISLTLVLLDLIIGLFALTIYGLIQIWRCSND